jgi:hypothetical protein
MTDAQQLEELIAFLDANIVLEGKPVADLPWEQVAATGTIRVLIVPRAMEEIDEKKRDGRLGPIARAFNRLIGPSVTSGAPVVLRETGPRVELQMATCSRIPWDDYDELDPHDGDGRIVAEALHVRDVRSANRLLISHDIKPLAYASGRGLPVHRASDDWLRGPEPSPQDKEINRLRQQLAEFRKDEPTFAITVEVSDVDPFEVFQVAALEQAEQNALVATIKSQNPRRPNGRSDPYGLNSLNNDRDSSYDGRYGHYVSKTVPEFAAAFGDKLEVLFNQRLLSIRVRNTGQIRADHLVASVSVSGGWINGRVVYLSPGGPAPPIPSPDYLQNINLHRDFMLGTMPQRVGRHEFETTLRVRRGREMEVACEDFRSGQEYLFEGVVGPSSRDVPLVISVSLTAKNIRGERKELFKQEKRIIQVEAGALIDLETLKPKRPYPTEREINRLIDTEEYGAIEYDGPDYD